MSDRTPTDPGADIVAQLLEVLGHTERSLALLAPLGGGSEAEGKYDRLRVLRDQLEEAFEVEQAARLRAGSINFAADVEQLRVVMKDLEEATRRAGRVQEVLGYVSMAIDLVSNVMVKVAPFL